MDRRIECEKIIM